jgi:flagellum-specific peptidoglycan hydrolase FlgJ
VTTDTQKPKFENGNSELGSASTAPQASHFGLRISAGSPHLTPQQLQFLLRVTPPALQSQREFEIPACVTLAQTILESATAAGWGSSSLFRLANNPFGIKYEHYGPGNCANGPSGHRIVGGIDKPSMDDQMNRSIDEPISPPYGHFDAPTWEIENGQRKVIVAQFQRFPNLAEAFIAHAQLLRSPRYRPAFNVRHDWKQFAERLGPKASTLDSEHCGYSTNPNYSAELIRLVNLYRLNDPRAVEWYATGTDPGNRAIEHSSQRIIGPVVNGEIAAPGTDAQVGRSTDAPIERQPARAET